MSVLRRIKRLVPNVWRLQYHHLVAVLASWRYGRPSRHLVVIGVTGTDGKTTTASLIADVLGADGTKVGLSTSALFQVADRRWTNETHLTMPGRFALQRMLRQMVDAGCTRAVIEVSSEGLAQYRHAGIDFDTAVITNLSAEHIEAHGSLMAYRQAKGRLFGAIIRGGDKTIAGQVVPKATVVNLDDHEHEYFLQFWAESHYGTSLAVHEHPSQVDHEKLTVLTPTAVKTDRQGSTFELAGQQFSVPLPGEYNVRNALQAIAVGRALGLEWATLAAGLAKARPVPGRWETIDSGRGWSVVIDYALTPQALKTFYTAVTAAGARRIIAVLGAAGGGRDVWKRPELGQIAARHCAQIFLTTDDPYDEDPQSIAAAIQRGIPTEDQPKVKIILDRREAIRRAIAEAQPGDVVTVTGMGSETSMMVKRHSVAWNDVAVVQEELRHG